MAKTVYLEAYLEISKALDLAIHTIKAGYIHFDEYKMVAERLRGIEKTRRGLSRTFTRLLHPDIPESQWPKLLEPGYFDSRIPTKKKVTRRRSR